MPRIAELPKYVAVAQLPNAEVGVADNERNDIIAQMDARQRISSYKSQQAAHYRKLKITYAVSSVFLMFGVGSVFFFTGHETLFEMSFFVGFVCAALAVRAEKIENIYKRAAATAGRVQPPFPLAFV